MMMGGMHMPHPHPGGGPHHPMMMHMPPPHPGGGPPPHPGYFPGMMPGMPMGMMPPAYPPGMFGSPMSSSMAPPSVSTTAGGDISETATGKKGKESSEVHVITLHPRGMPRPFDIPFPMRRLPVCDKCKKNYKSRDLCRTRDNHKTLPWTTTYVVVTIDKSLLVEDTEDGRMFYNADMPAIGVMMDTPIMCLGPSDGSMKSEPICKVCREKNYTKDYCRNTCNHTTPPWSTTYVKLVPDTRSESERALGYGSSKSKNNNRKRKKSATDDDGEDGKIKNEIVEEVDNMGAYEASYVGKESDVLKSDDLAVIHQSRTFLAAVSSKSVIVRWCERIQYPESAENTTLETALKKIRDGGDNNEESNNIATAASNSNVTNEQLWDAFRAGVMWATSQQGQLPPGAMPQAYGGYGMPMQQGMGYYNGHGGEMPPGGPWGGGFGGGYGNQMNGSQVGTPVADGKDWNKNDEAEEAVNGENLEERGDLDV
eukprot:scaffold293325_cov132-Cyclotella_meneghiniana.AAC.1